MTTFGRLLFIAAPALLGLLVMMIGVARRAPLRVSAPLALLVLFWFIGAWFANRLQNRRLQRQIDELDALRAE